MIRKIITTLGFIGFIFTAPFAAQAFEFVFPIDGETVMAGSTIKASVNLGEIPMPFAVLFSVPQGLMISKLDSTAPFKWEFEIPADYYGPLTLWAIARRYNPIAYSPSTHVTVFVVRPALHLSLP